MRIELGGFSELSFSELGQKNGNIFEYLSDYNTIYTISGRSSIKLLAKNLRPGKILLPEYICGSISDSFDENQIQYYEVSDQLDIDIKSLEKLISFETSAIFLINYFGFIQTDEVLNYLNEKKKEYGFIIIEDTTHSIFSNKNVIGDYCVCSLRKWFPCEGGVLYTKMSLDDIDQSYIENSVPSEMFDARVMKFHAIKENLDIEDKYMQIYRGMEKKIEEDTTVRYIDDLSVKVLSGISVYEVIEKRKKNIDFIYEQLSNIIVPFCDNYKGEVLIAVPLICDNRDSLREFLIKNRIFCAVHWPQDKNRTERAKRISKKLISIMIDQRYGELHMQYLVDKIRDYYNEKNMCDHNN